MGAGVFPRGRDGGPSKGIFVGGGEGDRAPGVGAEGVGGTAIAVV